MKLELVIDKTGESHQIEAPAVIIIGRSPSADLVIADRKVSRRHCRLDLTLSSCTIGDLHSGNGTLVNGRRVDQTELFEGDEITLGNSHLRVTGGKKRESSLDADRSCSSCGRSLSLATFADGDVVEAAGHFLCPICAKERAPGTPLLPGYTVLGRLGEGASGIVYRARQHAYERIVALKVLRVSPKSNARDVMRFIRGARSEAVLIHPNIIQVYDFGVESDLYFMAMEYYDAKNLLSEMKQRGALDISETVDIGRQITRALAYAFDRNIVHRDLKPENILIRNGLVKISDFGLAKNFTETGLSGLTRPGEGMGTLAYMPPEQIDNAVSADQRSDIYSLGATLYHVVTGRLPFQGRRPRDVIRQIRSEDPLPVTLYNPDIPDRLVAIIQRAMLKDPSLRFQTPAELLEVLEDMFEEILEDEAGPSTCVD